MDPKDYLAALEREKAGYEQAGNKARAGLVADEIRRVRAEGRKAAPKKTAVDGPPETTAS